MSMSPPPSLHAGQACRRFYGLGCDGALYRILAPAVYIFFCSAIPALAFGQQLAEYTDGVRFRGRNHFAYSRRTIAIPIASFTATTSQRQSCSDSQQVVQWTHFPSARVMGHFPQIGH